MDHSGFKSGWATNDDSMRQHWGTSVILQVTQDNTNPTKKGAKGLDKPNGVHYNIFP
jgi:hypothetical protein